MSNNTIYQITTKELEAMLNTPFYFQEVYPNHSHPTFENLNEYGNIRGVWDYLVTELGRIPSQKEYIAEGMKRAQKFFSPRPGKKADVTRYWGKGDIHSAVFNWNDPTLQEAVIKRLSRSYPSFIAEFTTIIQLKELYPNFLIGANDWMDMTAGIDIVVASPEHNRIAYIHVTSNSNSSRMFLTKKQGRWGAAVDSDNKVHWYERNFNKGHVYLAFDRTEEKDSTTTRFVNGNPFFLPEHLINVIDTAMNAPDPSCNQFDTWMVNALFYKTSDNQLIKMNKFLIDNNIDEDGFGQLWV